MKSEGVALWLSLIANLAVLAGLIEERYWTNLNAWSSSILHRGPGYERWWALA